MHLFKRMRERKYCEGWEVSSLNVTLTRFRNVCGIIHVFWNQVKSRASIQLATCTLQGEYE